MTADCKSLANDLQSAVIQGFDPAEIRIVVLETDGAAVDENHRVPAPVDFIVNLDTVVLDCGHERRLVDGADGMILPSIE